MATLDEDGLSQRTDLAELTSAPRPIEIIASLAQRTGEIDVGAMKEIMALHREEEARQAERALYAALAGFQSECPQIRKTKGIPDNKGAIKYRYAPLESIIDQVRPLLLDHGLAYHFDTEHDSHGVRVICVITHVAGGKHQGSAFIPGVQVPRANAAQNASAGITYGKRIAFLNALGIMTADSDTDGVEPQPPQDDTPLTDEQVADLQSVLDECGDKLDRQAFFGWLSVKCRREIKTLDEVPSWAYAEAMRAAVRKRDTA